MKIPKTIEDATLELISMINDEDKKRIKNKEISASSLHHTLGTWVRNNWGLWTGSILSEKLSNKGIVHPDDMSYELINNMIKSIRYDY